MDIRISQYYVSVANPDFVLKIAEVYSHNSESFVHGHTLTGYPRSFSIYEFRKYFRLISEEELSWHLLQSQR